MTTIRAVLACGSPHISTLVLECLHLRSLTTALMHKAPDAVIDRASQTAARCSARGWRTFLRAERCGIWFHDTLKSLNLLDSLPAAVRDTLLQRRHQELRRVLTARAQLRDLASLAGDTNEEMIVLKGATEIVHDARFLDLDDVDILPLTDDPEHFAHLLDRAGYAAALPVESTSHHLPPRRKNGCLDVEVHRSIADIDAALLTEMRQRAIPVATLPGLCQFAPGDQLWHLLIHVGVQHLARRGAVRDQLLIRSAALACSERERESVDVLIRNHPAAVTLEALLRSAVGTHSKWKSGDPFLQLAAARYAANAAIFSHVRLPPAWIWAPFNEFTVELAVDRAAYRRHFGALGRPSSAVGNLMFPAVVPKAVRYCVLIALRVLRLLSLTPPAALLAVRSRGVARRFAAARLDMKWA